MFSKAESITMKLDGIHDAASRRAAVQVLREMPGVRSASVRQGAANVSFYPDKTTVPEMTAALADAGFSVI
ncbi:MAG: heavy-metal-associated domain-containing protein [Clostridia bacterium]|nr:heavy-metal-associated domain-containing protein [Clostridia bacterium]